MAALQYATFTIDGHFFGINVLVVREINPHTEFTPVDRSPDYVRGLMNLRGQIVTIIDLGKKLALGETERSEMSRNIIVNSKDEYIGLLVSRISDVVEAEWDKVEPPPANIGGVQGKFFKGVFKTKERLIGILDVEKVLDNEK